MSEFDQQLTILRNQIDDIDEKILALLNLRAQHSRAVGDLKRQHGNTELITDSQREESVLTKLKAINQGPLTNTQVTDLYQMMFCQSRAIQLRQFDE